MEIFKIEKFARIDEVVYSETAQEARDKAHNLARLFTGETFSIPDVSEFEDIIKPKEVE